MGQWEAESGWKGKEKRREFVERRRGGNAGRGEGGKIQRGAGEEWVLYLRERGFYLKG